MRLLMTLLLLASTSMCFAVPYMVPPESGFKILRPGNSNGVGIPATASANRDPQYPYWGSYCGESANILCWPVAPRSEFVVPAGTSKVTLLLYSDTGYGTANVFYDGVPYSMSLHTYGATSGRVYRLQTYADIAMTSSTCDGSSPSRTFTPHSYESGATRVYRLFHSARWTNCTLTFDDLSLATDARMSVSFNGMQFRYDNNIYARLPSGTDIFTTNQYADIVRYNFFDADGNSTGSGELFDRVAISGWINLDGYLDFSLISAPMQSITVGPDEQNTRFAYFDTLLKSNMPKVTTTIRCQHVLNQRCALSDGTTMIPMVTGVRADRLHTATYTAALRPSVPLRLTRDLGFSFHKDVNMVYMFGIEPSYLKANPDTFGKTFSGDITLIVEGDFE